MKIRNFYHCFGDAPDSAKCKECRFMSVFVFFLVNSLSHNYLMVSILRANQFGQNVKGICYEFLF